MSKKSTRKSKFGYFFGYLILNLLIFSVISGERGSKSNFFIHSKLASNIG